MHRSREAAYYSNNSRQFKHYPADLPQHAHPTPTTTKAGKNLSLSFRPPGLNAIVLNLSFALMLPASCMARLMTARRRKKAWA
jgi:hypothetical protein